MKKFKLPDNAVYDIYRSTTGLLLIVASVEGLHLILWESEKQKTDYQALINTLKPDQNHAIIQQTKKELTEYFDGKRQIFTIPLAMQGTDFQQQAWKVLQQIPYGKTVSYQQQAQLLGDKKKARAVGMANGVNPIPIIVPCHRVIGHNGKLTGFAGGLDIKAKLLNLEKGVVA